MKFRVLLLNIRSFSTSSKGFLKGEEHARSKDVLKGEEAAAATTATTATATTTAMTDGDDGGDGNDMGTDLSSPGVRL